MGLKSTSAVFSKDYLDYPCDIDIYQKQDAKIIQQIKRWQFLFRHASQYDIVHYNYGLGLLPWGFTEKWVGKSNPGRFWFQAYGRICAFLEKKILRPQGIAVTFQGDDARQGDYCLKNYQLSIAHARLEKYYTPGQDELNRRKVEYFEKEADLIYALNPDLLRVLPRRACFLPYAHLDPGDIIAESKEVGSRPMIVHAPTHRKVKGTEYLIEAVSRLKAEGISCELVLVEGVSHHAAIKIYQQADLIVDQLLAGWYGGFAVEAMALGKPVIGYIRPEDLNMIPASMAADLPVISSTPQSIFQVLKGWLTGRKADLRAKGRQGRAFVEKWHNPNEIAKRVVQDYQGVLQKKGFPLGETAVL